MNPEDLVGPAIIHSAGEIDYANREFGSLVGVDSPGKLVGRSLGSYIASPYRGPLAEKFERVETGESQELSLRLTLTGVDGTEREAISVSSPITWGERSRIRTSFIDISQVSADELLSVKGTAIHRAPIGITVADVTHEDYPVIYVNDGFVELTGYPREEILGQSCRILQGEETRAEPVARMRAAIEAEQPVTVEVRNYRKDGSLFWNRVTLSPIEDEHGDVTHYLGFQEDISETKAHERERFLFETYAEKSDTVMFITDRNGVIEYVNPAFERVTDYSAAEAVGRTPRILKSGEQDEAFYADLWETILAGDTWEAEIVNRTATGELYNTTQNITPITDDRGKIRYFVAIERDITKYQLKQQILDVLNRILRHNVRNSVTIIEGYAEFIESNPGDSDVRAAAQTIREHAGTLEQITERTATIRNLIALLEENETPPPVDLSRATEIVDRYRRKYDDAVIDVTIDCEEETAIRYGAVFEIALEELLENAIEHNDSETPQIEITIEKSATANEATIEIADNGPGVPRPTWEVIKSGEETPLRHTEGIGLWVVYWSVTAFGGKIELSENEPRGSVLALQVPLAERSESTTADHRIEKPKG